MIDELRLRNIAFFHPTTRKATAGEDLLDALEAASGVFLVGGSQMKLVSRLGGSVFMDKLKQRFENGLHIAGTSAGASALSSTMISSGKAGLRADTSSVRLAEGFSFVPEAIIDQHFRQRGRLGRLIAAVLQNPELIGIGLDEDTALEIRPQGEALVHGTGCVTIVDGLDARDHSNGAFQDVKLHSLTSGWTFNLEDRRPIAPCS